MRGIATKLLQINSWDDFFSFANALTEKGKGDIFEGLTKLILLIRPEYSCQLKNVWLLSEGIPSEIREKLNLPSTDEGIDLIAETIKGEYWAIQCKFKGKNQPPTYKELSTFSQLANNYCKNISLALLVHTGEKGVRKKHLLGENFTQIGLEFWLGLTDEDWKRIHQHIRGQSTRPKPRKPRPHQSNAIKQAYQHFVKNNASRGRLIMPCGTGKSLTAFWIANALKAKSVVVAVPSLALIKQSLEDWTREFVALKESPLPEWLVICSDESAGKIEKDEFVSDTYSLGIPTTTDIAKISAFLSEESKGRKIVFTTYHSSDKLAQASRISNYSFDLAILDEAHKTVGVKSKTFATLLTDDNIKISRRIFMTATERVLRGESEEIFSMDDTDIYGEQFYQLTFKEAINSDPPIISDYKILTITVSEEEIQELIKQNKLITDKTFQEQESQSLAAAIALRKATQNYGIRHAISFHRSIRNASNFSDLNAELNHINIDDVNLNASHISSKKSAGERARLMKDFTVEKLALMTNARCLNEGVDVPAIDCVLFADPKQSVIDIVQAAGRALRPYAGKEFGYIMLPLIVPDGIEFTEFAESTAFREVARIIAALSTQDERIAEEFRITTSGKHMGGGGRIEFTGTVPVGMKLDLTDFAATINAKIWEKVAKVNWRSFEEARAFIQTLGIKNNDEWREYTKSGRKPDDIPVAPEQVYKDEGWLNWGDWFGTGTISNQLREFRSYLEARPFVHDLKLKNHNEWLDYCKSGKMPDDIPNAPEHLYKGIGWSNWGDWLGTGAISARLKKYCPFEEARAFVHLLMLKNGDEWMDYCRSGKKPEDIPAFPIRTYKGKGWISMGDWLGTGSIADSLREYRPFEKARAFVHALMLKNVDEWREYCKSGEKPDDISANPNRTYENKGWRNMGDWLGTGTIATLQREYRSFKEARAFVHALKLTSQKEWNNFCHSGKKPDDIPNAPAHTYKDKGWSSWGDWLGTGNIATSLREYRSFVKAKEFVHQLKLSGIIEWGEYCKLGEKPDDIPANPNSTYKEEGWTTWGDWFGTGTIANFLIEYRSFAKARAFVHELKLKNQVEWKGYCKSGNKPDDIPANPYQTYKKQGWIGFGDWLGTGTVATFQREYRPFENARTFVQELKLKNQPEWKEYCNSGRKPNDIPNAPAHTYKGKGWSSWGDWLGTGTIAAQLKAYLSFEVARSFVEELKIKNQNEWYKYCQSGKKPDYIPSNPQRKYRGKGWAGWGNWLGTGAIANFNIVYRSFNEARAFVHNLQLNSANEWRAYCKSGGKPDNIPSAPQRTYQDNGWSNWGDWLGKIKI